MAVAETDMVVVVVPVIDPAASVNVGVPDETLVVLSVTPDVVPLAVVSVVTCGLNKPLPVMELDVVLVVDDVADTVVVPMMVPVIDPSALVVVVADA